MTEEKVLLEATLCLAIRGREILLARKTKKIGAGSWNGYGGGIEPGETPEACAVRELREESSMEAKERSLDKVALIDFHNTKADGKTFVCRMHVYLVREWKGEPRATDEMAEPTWFNIGSLPFERMMLADRQWLPLVAAGRKIRAKAAYGPFQQTLLGPVEIEDVESF